MKKYCIIIFLIFNLHQIECQSIIDRLRFYTTGINYLKKNDFQKADSMFTKYIDSASPFLWFSCYATGFSDVFYHRAIAKLGLKDTVSACSDFYNASFFNDNDSYQIYCNNCVNSIDSIYVDKKYNRTKKQNARFLEISFFDKYKNRKLGKIVDLRIKKFSHTFVNFGNLVGAYYINGNDTIYDIFNTNYIPHTRSAFEK